MLIDGTLGDFAQQLARGTATPGGGSAAALTGALGCSLGEMVANFTLGKVKYRESWPVIEQALRALSRCRQRLLELVDHDAEAYATVSAAYGLPRESHPQQQARQAAIQAALRVAAQTPLTIIEQAAEACAWLPVLLDHGNPNLISDTGVAADLLQSSLRSAWLNVEINLAGITDDEYKATIKEQMQTRITQAENTASAAWGRVMTQVTGNQ